MSSAGRQPVRARVSCVASTCVSCSHRVLSCAVFLQGGIAPRQTRHSHAVEPLPDTQCLWDLLEAC